MSHKQTEAYNEYMGENMPQNHTKTPWTIRTIKAGTSGITGEQYYDHILEPLNALIERNSAEQSANAKFIVKAVNSHEKLVKALQIALKEIKELQEEQPDALTISGLTEDFIEQALKESES